MSRTARVRIDVQVARNLGLEDARLALYAWLVARSQGGELVLSINDLTGVGASAVEESPPLDDLLWLGLGWDEGSTAGGERGPYRRSERLHLYHTAAIDLIRGDHAYACFCPGSPIDARAGAGPRPACAADCASLPAREAATRQRAAEHSVIDRGGVPSGAAIVDVVRGATAIDSAPPGEFMLLDRQGHPAAPFADAVDDLLLGITHVIRDDRQHGDVARYVVVRAALGGGRPDLLAHLPRIETPTPDGGKGVDQPHTIKRFRDAGYPPGALINALALLGFRPPGGQELLTREELIAGFDMARVGPTAVAFDPGKLDALARRHIERMTEQRMAELATEQLVRAGLLHEPIPAGGKGWAGRLARLFSDRLARFGDLPGHAALLFEFDPRASLADPEVLRALVEPESRRVVESLAARLGDDPVNAPRFQLLVDEVRRDTGARGERLFQTLRVALTGARHGPELVKLLPLIEEGNRMPLPRRMAGCAERARSLLEATSGVVE